MTDGGRLRRSDDLLADARAILARERARLAPITDAPLELTGGSSVAGALTVGDVDLHLRVPPSEFATVVERLRAMYEVVLPEIWSATIATFAVRGEAVGIAVTPIGSEHDRRFTEAWDRLRSDRAALDAYNAMKREAASDGDEAYRSAKAAFFDRLAGGSG